MIGLTVSAPAFAAVDAEPDDPAPPGEDTGLHRTGRLLAARVLLRKTAEQTGLEPCAPLAELAAGKTPAEIAVEQGAEPVDIVSALLEQL